MVDISVKALFGVGAARAAAYGRVGVETIEDLIYYFPRAYENRGDIKTLAVCTPEEHSAVILTVASEPRGATIRRGMSLLKFRAFDESGVCAVTYFNQNYLRERFTVGSVFRFWGRVERAGAGFAMNSPVAEPYAEGLPLPSLVPVYRLSEGLTQGQVQKDIRAALSMLSDKLRDSLPEKIRSANRLCTLAFALRNIHEPESYEALAAAKRRLIFDEFFMFAAGLSAAGRRLREGGAAPCLENDISPLSRLLPYTLTRAQLRVINEIRADMERETPMRRIVVGDVGCGKTICAAAAMLVAVRSGRQAALMAPTEILARQHYDELSPLFEQLGIGCALLLGASGPARKKKIKEALAAPDKSARLDIVIGTHALLSEGVEFAAPGLAVTDEQHRFGVEQRGALSGKSSRAHVLVMSATPIPRSLALVMYGDLDISRVDQMPPGRQRVDTFVVDEGYRPRIDGFIRRLVGEGGQVYVICPSIEDRGEESEGEIPLSNISPIGVEEEHPPLKAVESYAANLSERMPDIKIALMHGRMKSSEKERIMREFASGGISVLVSTTVIEVGVNVPNACMMIVENAERFGLSQLHQLRGRVGRGSRKSYCILVSDAASEKAKKRLGTMRSTFDGYLIAETDLALRGPGDFITGESGGSVRQSGGVRFRLAGLCDDAALMSAAFEAARELTKRDPELEEYPELRRAVERMFGGRTADIS